MAIIARRLGGAFEMKDALGVVVALIAVGLCAYSTARLGAKIRDKRAKLPDYGIHFSVVVFWIAYYWQYFSSLF